MDKFERYAVSHYLSKLPDPLNYRGILKALTENDDEYDITVNETYELYEGFDVAHMIIDMVESLRRVFNE